MRRKDREVTAETAIDEIIRNCAICRIGFVDKGSVYIVPLNFGFEKQSEQRIFYFHSAKEGRKIELIKAKPMVGFEMDTNYQLKTGELACDHSARFQSVIGTGQISFVDAPEEKLLGLQSIMRHSTKKADWQFNAAMIDRVRVFKVVVAELACKDHE